MPAHSLPEVGDWVEYRLFRDGNTESRIGQVTAVVTFGPKSFEPGTVACVRERGQEQISRTWAGLCRKLTPSEVAELEVTDA